MDSVCWDAKGIVFIDHFQKCNNINGECYANLMMELKMAIKTKCQGKPVKSVLFDPGSALAHTSLVSVMTVSWV